MDRATVEHLRPSGGSSGPPPTAPPAAGPRPRPSPPGWHPAGSASTWAAGPGATSPTWAPRWWPSTPRRSCWRPAGSRSPTPSTSWATWSTCPFARGSIGGAWSWMTHLHVPRRPAAPGPVGPAPGAGASGSPVRATGAGGRSTRARTCPATSSAGRFFAGWSRHRLVDMVTGAGFEVEPGLAGRDPGTRSGCGRCGPAPWPTPSDRGCAYWCAGSTRRGTRPTPGWATPGRATASGRRRWPPASSTRDRDPVAALVASRGGHDRLRQAAQPHGGRGDRSDEYRGRIRTGRAAGGVAPTRGRSASPGCPGGGTWSIQGGGRPPARGHRRAPGLRHAVDQRAQRPDLAGRAGRPHAARRGMLGGSA